MRFRYRRPVINIDLHKKGNESAIEKIIDLVYF